MKRQVVLSMDIEDWYHLEYFDNMQCDKNYSFLDGINTYCEILQKYKVPSSFFIVGEIAESLSSTLREIVKEKHEISSHGMNHIRPITISLSEFYKELDRSKKTLEDLLGTQIDGYRAPCFSMDRQRLDLVQKAGFSYDSSRIDFGAHPLYETIDMDGYELVIPNIFRDNNFFEFQANTYSVYGKNMPISGGGYLRLLPWGVSKKLIKSYLNQSKYYMLYIHPFELSPKPNPPFPSTSKWYNRLRFGMGRSTVAEKLSRLIDLLKESGYSFTTFSSLRKELLK
jgi:polysaccharide deacetylase family protein (PEP-CTERM system associated)